MGWFWLGGGGGGLVVVVVGYVGNLLGSINYIILLCRNIILISRRKIKVGMLDVL